MGNFSVNHYALIKVGQPATSVLFVLDLAELPTLELLQRWGLEKTSARSDLDRKAIAESRSWVRQVQITANGKRLTPIWQSAELVLADGAGGLPVIRINSRFRVGASPGTLTYLDGTYPDRTAGWKEVVVQPANGVTIKDSTAPKTDRSQALTAYPQDPLTSPPQELIATINWTGELPLVTAAPPRVAEKKQQKSDVVLLSPELPSSSTGKTGAAVAERNSGGQVRRGDFLSTTLQGEKIGWGLGLICVAVAFWFGALHALEPGHGKTMVAAYLVGERGTPKHAVLLGGMVTFTHTVSVFILGLLTMFLAQYIRADVISKWLGVVSGLTIVWIGVLLFYRRTRSLTAMAGEHGHSHSHGTMPAHTQSHGSYTHTHVPRSGHASLEERGPSPSRDQVSRVHTQTQTHTEGAIAGHTHSHGALTHTHGGHTHSHAVEGEISMRSLIALGASGGLVPCPSALVLLLAAVSMGRTGFGLLLLISFSLGLALVLMATGLLVLYAKRFIPARPDRKPNALAKLLPVVSAAVITIVGVVLTGNALGLIPVIRFFG